MLSSKPALQPSSRATGAGAVLLTAGGFAAAFAVASCCAIPMLLGALGLGSAWLFQFAVLAAPHRTSILISGAIAIVAAAMVLWRQRTVECAPGAVCMRPLVRRATMIALFVSALLLVAGYAYT